MQSVQSKNGYAMTTAACIWLGLFPLLQTGTYSHITYDKWIIMLILTGVTLICFILDSIIFFLIRRKQSQNTPSVTPDTCEGSPRRSVVPGLRPPSLDRRFLLPQPLRSEDLPVR